MSRYRRLTVGFPNTISRSSAVKSTAFSVPIRSDDRFGLPLIRIYFCVAKPSLFSENRHL